MPDDNLTEEETTLALSAKDAHSYIEMCNSNGWKNIKKKYFDVTLKECKEYLEDAKNTDMIMIQAKRLQIEWIQVLLNEITMQVEEGLKDEKELTERKEKKKKIKERGK